MINKIFLLALFSTGFAFSKLLAQGGSTNTPPPPTPPFVQELPANSAWKITMTEKASLIGAPIPPPARPPPVGAGAGAPATPLLLKEEKFTRMDNDLRIVKTWSNGSTSEEWRYQGFILYSQPYTPAVYVINKSDRLSGMFATMSQATFPELDWLTSDNYVRVEGYKGRSVYVFQEVVAPTKGSSGSPVEGKQLIAGRPPRKAWIDCETKLPITLDNGDTTQNYQYEAPPTAKLTLPAAFASALEKMQPNSAGPHPGRMAL